MTKMSLKYNRIGFSYIVLLVLFTIVTALGTFNPFSTVEASIRENSASIITLTIQGCFIVSLILLKNANKLLNKDFGILCVFTLVWCLSGILHGMYDIDIPFGISVLKLVLCIILFYKLPQLLIRSPKQLVFSILLFSLTCSVIASLFMLGFLDSYVFWSKGRAFIFYENANSTSTRMAFSILFILYIVFQNPLKWSSRRNYILLFVIPLIYAIMASGSRGSFIVLVICVAMYLLLLPSRKPIVKVAIIIFSSIVIIGTIIKISEKEDFVILDRINDTIEKNDDTGRSALSSAALDIFEDNFILGVGAVEFPIMMKEHGYKVTVHNMYWYIAATSGVIGLSLFGLFLIHLLKRTWKYRQKNPLAFVLLCGMLLIASKTGGVLTYMTMWYVFALTMAFTQIFKFR